MEQKKEDIRFKKLEEDIEKEKQLTTAFFSFKGFGRSTGTAEELNKVEQEGSKRLRSLVSLVTAEEEYLANPNKATAQALTSAMDNYQKLVEEFRQRSIKKTQDLLEVGRAVGQKEREKLRDRSRTTPIRRVKVFVLKIKNPTTSKSVKPQFNKSFPLKSAGELRKKNIVPQKPISAILQNRGFGRNKTLANNNA